MSDDATEYDYPPSWAPKGAEPPKQPNYTPKLRSGLGFTGDEQHDDDDAYPAGWRRFNS
jgi:hypothetical protein